MLVYDAHNIKTSHRQLVGGKPVVAVCNSAYRSSMAIGILERKGFKNATSMEGGSEAWIEAGLPVYGAEKGGSPVASA